MLSTCSPAVRNAAFACCTLDRTLVTLRESRSATARTSFGEQSSASHKVMSIVTARSCLPRSIRESVAVLTPQRRANSDNVV